MNNIVIFQTINQLNPLYAINRALEIIAGAQRQRGIVPRRKNKMIINLLTDAPKHNLALMQISAYHKEQGDDVYLNFPLMPADRTYVSLLFTSSIGALSGDFYGGPAFSGRGIWGDSNLPLGIEFRNCKPDWSLYNLDYSLGYSFRPCYRNCSFCKVGSMPHPDTVHHSIWEWHNSKYHKICLLNNNTFLDKQWKETFQEIWDAKLTVIDENGYDARLIDDEKADFLKRTKFQGKLHFAWDRISDETEIVRGANILRKHRIRGTFYILIGYDSIENEDIHRCQVLKDLGFDFYIMPYGGSWQGKMFKRFIDSFIWRKYKTIAEAWKNYKPRAHIVCAEAQLTAYNKAMVGSTRKF